MKIASVAELIKWVNTAACEEGRRGEESAEKTSFNVRILATAMRRLANGST